MEHKGFALPNHTQIPNSFFDESLPHIKSIGELKVLMAIMRKTFGWRKFTDQISTSQLVAATGLTRQGVINGLKLGLGHGYIERTPIGQSFSYGLKLVKELDQSSKLTSQVNRPELVKEVDQLLVKQIDPQKKEEKERKKESSARDFLSELKDDPLYAHVDFNTELELMRRWLARPANKGRRLTERFVMNWINKIDRPVAIPAGNGKVKKVESAEQKELRESCLRCFGTGTETVAGKGARLCNHEKSEGENNAEEIRTRSKVNQHLQQSS